MTSLWMHCDQCQEQASTWSIRRMMSHRHAFQTWNSPFQAEKSMFASFPRDSLNDRSYYRLGSGGCVILVTISLQSLYGRENSGMSRLRATIHERIICHWAGHDTLWETAPFGDFQYRRVQSTAWGGLAQSIKSNLLCYPTISLNSVHSVGTY